MGEAVVDYLAPVRERYNALREDEGAARGDPGGGAAKAREIAVDTMRDVRAAMGVGPVASPALIRPRRRVPSHAVRPSATIQRPLRLVDLELDLEVFAGPV